MVGSRLRNAAMLHYSVLENQTKTKQKDSSEMWNTWVSGDAAMTERKYMPVCQLINLLFRFFSSFYF